MDKVIKSDLIAAVRNSINKKYEVEGTNQALTIALVKEVVDQTFNSIVDSVNAGNEVTLVGFGRFAIRTIKAHQQFSVKYQKLVMVPDRKKVVFYPYKEIDPNLSE